MLWRKAYFGVSDIILFQVIYKLQAMESRNDTLPLPMISMRGKGSKRSEIFNFSVCLEPCVCYFQNIVRVFAVRYNYVAMLLLIISVAIF